MMTAANEVNIVGILKLIAPEKRRSVRTTTDGEEIGHSQIDKVGNEIGHVHTQGYGTGHIRRDGAIAHQPCISGVKGIDESRTENEIVADGDCLISLIQAGACG